MEPASSAADTLWAHTWLNVAHAFLGQNHLNAIGDRIFYLQPPRRIPPHRNSLAARCVTAIWARLLHFELNPIAAAPTSLRPIALENIRKVGRGLRAIEKFYPCEEDWYRRRRAWLRSKGCGYELRRFLKLVRRANAGARSLLCGPMFVGALPREAGEGWKDTVEVYEDLAAGEFIVCTFGDQSGRALSSAEFAALERRLVLPAAVDNVARPHVTDPRVYPFNERVPSNADGPTWWPKFCLLNYDIWTAAEKPPMFAPGILDGWLGIHHDYNLNGWYWSPADWESRYNHYLEASETVPIIPDWDDLEGGPDTRALRKQHYNISWAKRRQRMARFL
ncbi:hypothetical protein HDU89_007713 [Geranomyces variabilis]|nr:hypothetical protein HDU89_007713 [Geranomyces variabilis]